MDRTEFLKEIEGYSQDDLRLIYTTQQDMYSDEELALIAERLALLPEPKKTSPLTVICYILSCFVPFFGIILGLVLGARTDDESRKRSGDYLVCGCLPSVFIGLIVSIVLLGSGDAQKKQTGKKCLLTACISIFISLFLFNGGFKV